MEYNFMLSEKELEELHLLFSEFCKRSEILHEILPKIYQSVSKRYDPKYGGSYGWSHCKYLVHAKVFSYLLQKPSEVKEGKILDLEAARNKAEDAASAYQETLGKYIVYQTPPSTESPDPPSPYWSNVMTPPPRSLGTPQPPQSPQAHQRLRSPRPPSTPQTPSNISGYDWPFAGSMQAASKKKDGEDEGKKDKKRKKSEHDKEDKNEKDRKKKKKK